MIKRKKVFKIIQNYTFIVLIFSFYGNTIKAQNDSIPKGIIYGVIVGETNEYMPFVNVALLKAQDSTVLKGTLTKENGLFSFDKLKPGSYLIVASYMGYRRTFKGPYYIKDKSFSVNLGEFKIDSESKQLKEVVVSFKKPLIEFMSNKTVLNVGNSSLAVGNSALDILQNAPGVNVYQDGNISLRGRPGVVVMIDEKPTYLSSDQLKTFLKSTAGSSIESIEIINNPSAKLDAAGSSGIINIKLKKNKQSGLNGLISAGSGYGKNYKSNLGANFNYRVDKFNLYGNYYYSNEKMESELNIDRVNKNSNGTTYFNQLGANIGAGKNGNFKAGLDFFLNKSNTLGVEFKGYENAWNERLSNNTSIGNMVPPTDSSLVTNTNVHNKYINTAYNVSYKYDIDTTGQQLTVSIDHSRFSNKQNSFYLNQFYQSLGASDPVNSIFRITAPSKIRIWSGKIDYRYVFQKNITLDFGAKSSSVTNDNDFLFENSSNEGWINDAKRSNKFIYDENINAGYFNLKGEIWKTTIELGLRIEHTKSKGNSITEDKIVNRSYLDFFPSVSLHKTLDEGNSVGISYNRRIDRPNYSTLNPFIYFTDPYTFIEGNPFLKPQYTNSFSLSYAHKNKLNLSLTRNNTKDFISGIIILDPIKKALFQTTKNLEKQQSYNFNINKGIDITKWWTSNYNLTIYYNDFKIQDILGAPYGAARFAFNINSIHNMDVSKSWMIEFSANYQSAELYGTDLIKPIYSANFGVNKSLFKNRADIKFLINDIFNTSNYRFRSNLDIQNYTFYIKPETRVFRLTFSYKIGGNRASNGIDKKPLDEENRVKFSN